MKRFKLGIVFILAISLMVSGAFAAAGLTVGDQTITGQKTFEHPAFFNKAVTFKGPILGAGVQTGNVFYVEDAGADSPGNYGKTYDKPFASVDFAIGQCAANHGDIIYVLPGHAESFTAADGFDADVASITIVMLGEGSSAPTFTFADTDATIAIGAAGVRIYGGRYLAGISEVVTGISVETAADDVILDGLVFPEPTTSTFEFDKTIVLASASDRVSILNCLAYSADATGATDWLDMTAGVNNGTIIQGNIVHGEYANAPIYSDKADLETYIQGNTITNMTTGQLAIEFTAAATGVCSDNILYSDAYATTLDPGSMKCSGNIAINAIDVDGTPIPAAEDSTSNLLGVNDADNAAATTSVVANEDGSVLERLEQIQETVNAGSGTSIGANKSVVDLLGTTGVALVDDALSVVGILGVNDADNAFSSSTIVANKDGSMLERDEVLQTSAAPSKNHPNYFTVTADMTSATWNTAAVHEIATVTGACRVQIMVETTATIVTTGTNGTIALGFEGNTTAIFTATALDAALTGDVFSAVYGSAATTPASGADLQSALTHAIFDVAVVTGKDIGYTIATNAATTGTLTFHVWWTPLDSTGSVVAGAGGVL